MALSVVSFIITGIILYGIMCVMLWHLRRRRLYKSASKFEGPRTLPFIGNAHLFLGNGEYLLIKMEELGQMYPSPFRIWLGPRLFIVVTDPEHLKTIFQSPKALGRGEVAEFGRPVFGTGLFAAPVAKWQVHRKLIQPTFNTKILNSFVEVFAAQSKIFTEALERNLDGPEFEIFNLISSCTLDMICETALGVKIGAQMNRNFSYVEAMQEVMTCLCKRFFHIWLHPDIIFYRTQVGRDQIKYLKCMYDFTNNVIQMRRNELLQGISKNEDDAQDPTIRRGVFLDHLLKLSYDSANLGDEAIRDEVDTMVVTGNDTTAITVSNVMLMLASHPDVQDKVYQELCEIYGDESEECDVTPKDLPRMKYLERVIKETMRLFPIAPLMVREVTEDLNIGEHTIPSGSSAVVATLRVHRNDEYWPDPVKFNPDRFLPEEIAKRHPYAYMAFSGGPRNCIGSNYALMSMKTLFATVLRRYILKKDNIVPVKDIRLKVEVLLKTVDPITLRIERRNRNSVSFLQLSNRTA